MSRVARRYAKAVFALAREEQQLEPVGEQVAGVARLFENPGMAAVASSPLVPAERRRALVRAIAGELGLSSLVSRFLLLLADRARLDQIASVADHYRRMEDDALGRVRLRIRSAAALADQEREHITAVFEKALGRAVIPEVEVDPALVAGVLVETGGKVYDGSVRSQLERLAQRIARSEIHP